MELLLDTHAFLWLRSEPEKISQTVLEAYYNVNNDIFLSIVSVWEIQIKHQLGKLELNVPLQQLIDTQIQQNGLRILPISPDHVYALNTIPFYHKDPFDRLLIVQAKLENLQLVSVDGVFKQYEVELFW